MPNGAGMVLEDRIVYAGGEYQRYGDVRVGLLTHGLQYGTGCFEGVRGFWNPEHGELYLLQLEDHYVRLAASAKVLFMTLPLSPAKLAELTVELCRRNEYREDVYIRPVIYKSSEDVGVRLHGVNQAFAIIVIPFDRYFDSSLGLNACVSSWRRIDDTIAPARGKITGIYVNSALAKTEAQLNGFDEAIFLSHDGHVAEGSAENIFLVKKNRLYTPDATQNILEGITRSNVLTITKDELGIEVVERAIDRSELYGAEEIFFTGSAAGIQWVRSVDHRVVGEGAEGPVVRAISRLYNDAIRGRIPRYQQWLTGAYAAERAVSVS